MNRTGYYIKVPSGAVLQKEVDVSLTLRISIHFADVLMLKIFN
jgi:hypothetical protein